jgi:D-alanyl-D-alanine carboxypeptidase
VTLKKLPDKTNQAAEEAYGPMCDMLSAARKDGMILEVCSSYRSVDRQKELFEEDMRALVRRGYSYLDAYDEVAKETMPPGYSEHATGLAFDIVALSYQMLNAKQETTAENKWLREHCAEYGFILRYPKEKEDITGISYESWHFRYVGVEIAQYIMENELTLEEFLAE